MSWTNTAIRHPTFKVNLNISPPTIGLCVVGNSVGGGLVGFFFSKQQIRASITSLLKSSAALLALVDPKEIKRYTNSKNGFPNATKMLHTKVLLMLLESEGRA